MGWGGAVHILWQCGILNWKYKTLVTERHSQEHKHPLLHYKSQKLTPFFTFKQHFRLERDSIRHTQPAVVTKYGLLLFPLSAGMQTSINLVRPKRHVIPYPRKTNQNHTKITNVLGSNCSSVTITQYRSSIQWEYCNFFYYQTELMKSSNAAF